MVMMHSIVGRQRLAGCKPCVQFVGNFLLSIKLCTVFSTAVVSPVGCPRQITSDICHSLMISHTPKTSNIPDRVGVVHYILQETGQVRGGLAGSLHEGIQQGLPPVEKPDIEILQAGSPASRSAA